MNAQPRPLKGFAPRLLPVTVACLAALLVVKSVSLVRAAVPASASAAAPAGSVPAAPAPVPAKPTARPPATTQSPAVPTTPAPLAVPAARPAEVPVSDSERALLLELRQRREELDARTQAAAAREALLAAAERRINTRVEELKALQARLEALESNRSSRDEANWRGLVKVYETMKPRDAAVIMNELDMLVLLGVLDRMKETKTAPILAAMQPDRARLVTAELAQLRQRSNSPARPAPTLPAATTTPPTTPRGG